MPHIDYYFSLLSPWCYLAGDRLETIAARHGAAVTYKPLSHPQLFDRTGGTRREVRHASRLAYGRQDQMRWAKKLGMAMNFDPVFRGANPAPASYAVIAAQNAGGGDLGALVQGFLAAVWRDDRDISDDAVIRDRLAGAGFDPGLANSGLLTGAETYARNLDQAVEAGVFGVPFYIVTETDQRFWGQDRLEFLDNHLAALT